MTLHCISSGSVCNKCEINHLLYLSHENGYGRYLDNNRISGTLDVTRLIASGLVRSVSAIGSQGLSTLSMMNTDITDVIYNEGTIGGITTLMR